MRPTYNPPSGHFGAAIRVPSALPVQDAEPIFSIGDVVMHPAEGICSIEELRPMALSGAQRTYYILKPASEKNSSTVYLPVARGNAILRKLLNREDILSFIHRSREYNDLWIADPKQRRDVFSKILTEGDYAKIIRMTQEIRRDCVVREAEGKKPCAADQAILAEAERLLHQEFSYVLHLSAEETAEFIQREFGA